jgi:hypothetical protein
VLGADANIYPPMSTVLAEMGIALHEGFDAGRLASFAPDLVVIGNAMTGGNVTDRKPNRAGKNNRIGQMMAGVGMTTTVVADAPATRPRKSRT